MWIYTRNLDEIPLGYDVYLQRGSNYLGRIVMTPGGRGLASRWSRGMPGASRDIYRGWQETGRGAWRTTGPQMPIPEAEMPLYAAARSGGRVRFVPAAAARPRAS